jgi:hypothetical protein
VYKFDSNIIFNQPEFFKNHHIILNTYCYYFNLKMGPVKIRNNTLLKQNVKKMSELINIAKKIF